MNEIKIFDNPEFGKVRTMEINGEPYFVGKDVAIILGYAKPENALTTHVDGDDTLKQGVTDNLGRAQNTTLINESGLYSLIISSKLPKAKEFKRWVTSEVLPSIRKHGAYAVDELLNDPEFAIKTFTALKEERERSKRLSEQIEADKPKVIFADSVSAAKSSILVGDLAKLLKQNGINIGQNRLFEWLRQKGYLIKGGSSKNMPTQKAAEMGLFEVKVKRFVSDLNATARLACKTNILGNEVDTDDLIQHLIDKYGIDCRAEVKGM